MIVRSMLLSNVLYVDCSVSRCLPFSSTAVYLTHAFSHNSNHIGHPLYYTPIHVYHCFSLDILQFTTDPSNSLDVSFLWCSLSHSFSQPLLYFLSLIHHFPASTFTHYSATQTILFLSCTPSSKHTVTFPAQYKSRNKQPNQIPGQCLYYSNKKVIF